MEIAFFMGAPGSNKEEAPLTACFKLMKVLQQQSRHDPEAYCSPCVYFAGNLERAVSADLLENHEQCGLGFRPHDSGCSEMRTDNCSARKK